MSAEWPDLPIAKWKDTYATLHMWTQIIGKIRLALTPYVNHWWEAALYVTARGLTTSPIPMSKHDGQSFELSLDFTDHVLTVDAADGRRRVMALAPRSVADFHEELMALLRSLGVVVSFDRLPSEVPDPIPFDEDRVHASYEEEPVEEWFTLLRHADRLLKKFRGRFLGKCSPVHFFWGSFDLAVTRFSGRPAPERPDADNITRLAYSHEVSSCGFWPGSGNVLEAAFYSYAAPEPPGFDKAPVRPGAAFYNAPTKGYVLKTADVARAADPDRAVLELCQSTYDAAADLAKWDRASLERRPSRRKAA